MKNLRILITIIFCLFSITQIYTQTTKNQAVTPHREMRGIWIATLNNIDWPSAPGLSVEQLKRETTNILDRVKNLGFNTVFLQVRPSADAIYRSDIEPPTRFIVSENNDFSDFDPLEYWTDEAHRRGLELHAWINPFRVTTKMEFPCAENHLSKTHPEWLITYNDRLFLNPGLPEARAYLEKVVMDIVERYDIDGVHIDDYFYPYPVKNLPFEDGETYNTYHTENQSLDDWRRSNVDDVISTISAQIRTKKSYVAFGISPFGVWRNKTSDERGSETLAGITDYDILYADVLKWIENHWIDYVVPQIYWESGNKVADFNILTDWWANYATDQTQIFVGHAIFKINSGVKTWENPDEMPSQILKVRQNEKLEGSVLFSYRQFNRDLLGLENSLKNRLYTFKSLTSLKLENEINPINITSFHKSGNFLSWQTSDDGDNIRFYAIYRYKKGELFDPTDNKFLYDITSEPRIFLPPNNNRTKYSFRICVIDKYRHEHPISSRVTISY